MKKGFTLIELLIVIGILAVLATATVLVLNPAQLFAQARDSQRISDLSALKSAVAFYLSTASDPSLQFAGACATNHWGTIANATENFIASTTQHANIGTAVDGNGWIPVNFDDAAGRSPLSALPTDPVDPETVTQSYTYACDNTNKWFEINANMESVRYAAGGGDDVEGTDGGDQTGIYEVGNDPGLNI